MTLALSPAGHRYGYLKDAPDHRDFGVSRLTLAPAAARQASNLPLMGPPLDQGNQGSCTAHADCADREFLHWKEYARQGKPVTPGADGLFSPAFTYYVSRKEDGSLGQGDCGSYGRTTCQVAMKYGHVLRSEMPYKDSDFSTEPTPDQYKEALTWPTGGYHRLVTVDDMRSVIFSGYNFRVGFTVYQSFETDWSVKGYMPMPTANEAVLGGHEVLFIGYDDDKSAFLARNSWGKNWGLDGNFWFPYAAVVSSSIFSDAWTQHLGIWRKS